MRPPGRSRQLYLVKFADSVETCLEQNLDVFFEMSNPFERARRGIYGNCDQFKLVNTTYKINNSNNNTISSLKASKTIFKAYQFKPLLKFLNSNSRRILVADEVGLGKTIEAGHIFLELKARDEFKSALIICPNSLKVKWQSELMEKFGLNFKIYESLSDAVEDLKAHPQSACGILNYEKVRAKVSETGKSDEDSIYSNKLIDFLEESYRRYSIVLCDEAHKLRNHTTLQHKGVAGILEHADAAVFLTATPIMLGENDLYNLLHLLEPEVYDNPEVFRGLVNSNRPFVKAIAMLNANVPFAEIKDLLTFGQIEKVNRIGDYTYQTTTTVAEEYEGIPLYNKIIEILDGADNLSIRAMLQQDISSLSVINNVFSRTRKREVSTEERQQTERKAHKISIELNSDEQEIYYSVIENYLEDKGGVEYDNWGEEVIPRKALLGLIQKKRMIASSVYGYDLFVQNDCNTESFQKDLENTNTLTDTKVEKLLEIFNGIKSVGCSKIIVFSIFKFTVQYLSVVLRKKGYKVFLIHGDIKEREKIINSFKQSKEFSVLLSTEVGSEGLDMQFCSHLVNYDLPWNPMVIEQRIGRIDRFGQRAQQVHIYNLVVKNSIQELIYDRLLSRIGIFQGVIGELEMILGEMSSAFSSLESDLYGTQLSQGDREKKIYDIEKAIENQKLQLEEVEEGMTNALTNDIYFQNEIRKIRDNKLYVTEDELKNYIQMLIYEHLKSCEFKAVGKSEYALTVPKSTPKVLLNFLADNQPTGVDYDTLFRSYRNRLVEAFVDDYEHVFTFCQDFAFDNKHVDYINIYNPIIIAASVFFKKTISTVGKTFELKYKVPKSLGFEEGLYYLAVYSIEISRTVMGKIISSDMLVPIFYSVNGDAIILDEAVSMKLFGDIQENAEYVENQQCKQTVSDEAFANMESDFTLFISDYVSLKKEEIRVKDDSQKALRVRQVDDYYKIRIEKEESKVNEEKKLLEWIQDEKESGKIKSRLQLAINRLNKLKKDRAERLERINADNKFNVSYSLISLSKLIMY